MKLNLVIDGKGTVWIDDILLLKGTSGADYISSSCPAQTGFFNGEGAYLVRTYYGDFLKRTGLQSEGAQ